MVKDEVKKFFTTIWVHFRLINIINQFPLSKIIKCYKKLNKLSKEEEKSQFKKNDICSNCKKIGKAWCYKCDQGKTSGNNEMDKLIYKLQKKTKHHQHNLEWISYNRLQDIKHICNGGFAAIYSATWLDGAPKNSRTKERTSPIPVVLKQIKNSNNMTEVFINEVNLFY